MPGKFNRERIKAFILRRKLNALGLLVITAASALITLLCALNGFARTDVLAIVTVLLVALCFVQMRRMRSRFRTMRDFKGFRKKKER